MCYIWLKVHIKLCLSLMWCDVLKCIGYVLNASFLFMSVVYNIDLVGCVYTLDAMSCLVNNISDTSKISTTTNIPVNEHPALPFCGMIFGGGAIFYDVWVSVD